MHGIDLQLFFSGTFLSARLGYNNNKYMKDNLLSQLFALLDKMLEKTTREETITQIMTLLTKVFDTYSDAGVPVIPAEVPVVVTANVLDHKERVELLQTYLLQLKDYVSPGYNRDFCELIKYLIDDSKILTWLLATAKADYKCFNKLRIFKLARLMKQQHVLQYEKDTQLNKILELTDDDTSYRRNLNTEHNDDKEMLSYITAKMDCFQAAECNLKA